ncbi:DUF4338 domain-containing protein [Caldinitratiruptor microaerophilus]|uniref:Uncharacterized protein n=1 Tax=Caldinitratiruptor microaerophilus TaxID=671077 RepID=A0AA35CID0_9FIRM|nr:DUF4338 domain-containing protein [Caldinitratiruptor microaerophilus]BDG59512.1 hypothetical protein caldi_06020 [Caldinitratiruptor microaerophilus]
MSMSKAPIIGPRVFAPTLTEEHTERLQRTVMEFIASNNPEIVRSEIARVRLDIRELESRGTTELELLPTRKYLAALLLVRDLTAQGWEFTLKEGQLEVAPPVSHTDKSDAAKAKHAVRRSYQFARELQLNEPATSEFIRAMERRGVLKLLANGAELARRLGDVLAIPIQERPATLVERQIIRPSLQLVEAAARDDVTGLRLQDIWRYFRHYWSIPYQSQPGRNMFYLVRDLATPNKAIIGIAALGNAPMQLTPRDKRLLWSVEELRQFILRQEQAAKEAAKFNPAKGVQIRQDLENRLIRLAMAMERVITQAIDGIRLDGLLDDAKEVAALDDPTDEIINKLRAIAEQSANQRRLDLKQGNHEEITLLKQAFQDATEGRLEKVDWRRLSDTQLYRYKRARTLADALFARKLFRQTSLLQNPSSAIRQLLQNESGRRAIALAIAAMKRERVGTNMMELTVCGAIPPYTYLLGGKLVSMLMLSPEVWADYRDRYSGQVSYIASAMKGEPVVRPADLAFIGTTSLYAVGSSQYNRLRIPVRYVGGTGDALLTLEQLGYTNSYGTVHFSTEAAEALYRVDQAAKGMRNVNHIFGEGHSPKLRKLRAGLDALGLNSDLFLQHADQRIIYGAFLASNSEAVLRCEEDHLNYLLPMDQPKERTRQIANYWLQRWLASRISHEKGQEVLSKVASFRPEQFALSQELVAEPNQRTFLAELETEAKALASQQEPSGRPQGSEFVRHLYRSIGSYSDHLTEDERNWIHVPFDTIDNCVLEACGRNKHIIVTGNPGDGKTHLIERLRPSLEAEGAIVITDANAVPDEEILRQWKLARSEGRPFCLAINEFPLYKLLGVAPDFPPLREAWRQVKEALYYFDDERPAPPQENVQVIDLNHRNLLAPAVVKAVIARLTNDRFYQGLSHLDPMLKNRQRLMELRVQERLCDLLEALGRQGLHVTMRQLVGFVAYLLTGGQDRLTRERSQGNCDLHYYNLAFSGDGPLFEALRSFFDPAVVTHPRLDEALWTGQTRSEDWLQNGSPPIPQSAPSDHQETLFRSLKRRFYFEHVNGDSLLKMMPQDFVRFHRLLTQGDTNVAGLLRSIVLALNRFFVPNWDEHKDDILYLWTSHRYDAKAPDVFVATSYVSLDRLQIAIPKPAPWLQAWMGEGLPFLPQHFIVASKERDSLGKRATLLVDVELYLTLQDATRGFIEPTWNRSSTRRITRFIDDLRRVVSTSEPIHTVTAQSIKHGLSTVFKVQRSSHSSYQF